MMDYFLLLIGLFLFLSAVYIRRASDRGGVQWFAVLIGLIGLYLMLDGVGTLPASWPQ